MQLEFDRGFLTLGMLPSRLFSLFCYIFVLDLDFLISGVINLDWPEAALRFLILMSA